MGTFDFKRFSIRQEGSAMKVGTDGVLLGAWCGVEPWQSNALDIGMGTGLIALMMAQRSEALVIDAVEIDEGGYMQALANIDASPWAGRINCYHKRIQDFADYSGTEYDLIVSNPPYFNDSLLPPDERRKAARHTTSLSHAELLACINKLISDAGLFSVILPYGQADGFIGLAAENSLYPIRKTLVHPTTGTIPKRILMEFSKTGKDTPLKTDLLTIETGVRHRYSPEYKKLTKDFYLKF